MVIVIVGKIKVKLFELTQVVRVQAKIGIAFRLIEHIRKIVNLNH